MYNADGTQTTSGTFVQVSRLGMPLVNEVVIPLGQKVPKGGGYYQVGKPYEIAGLTYTPRNLPLMLIIYALAALPFFTNSVEQNLSTIAVVHCVFSIAVNDRITRIRPAAGKSR